MIEQMSAEKVDLALFYGYLFGLSTSLCILCVSYKSIDINELLFRKDRMFRQALKLANRKDGIITVLDLAVAAEVFPGKASKFLTKFARELEVELEIDGDTGTKFYRFTNGERILKRETKEVAKLYN